MNDPILLREWHVVALARDVGESKVRSARLMGRDLVLWRVHGRVQVWEDLCIHRGAKLSLGKTTADGCLQCPYHGWSYDSEGACVRIPAHPGMKPPAKAHARVYSSSEAYGWIWVNLSDNPAPIPPYPEWGKAGFQNFNQGPVEIAALGPRIIENFLDLSHLPILHAGTLGDPEHAEIGKFTVSRTAGGISSRGIKIWQPDPDGKGRGADVEYGYDVIAPLAAYLSKSVGNGILTIMITATPIDEARSMACLTFATQTDNPVAERDFIAWADGILAQDIPIVESQKPERLPLDLQAELHLPSDRTSIAYRQWLNEIGLKFGTA